MLTIVLVCFLSFALGAILGQFLVKRGVQGDFRLERHQGSILGGLILLTIVILATVAFQNSEFGESFPSLLPNIVQVYCQAMIWHLILGMCCLGMGMLIFLEKGRWRSRWHIIQLFVALVLIALPFSLVLHYSRPVSASVLGKPKTVEAIVLQTTDYTCVPAAIATLMRYTERDPNFSEAEALRLTKTSRWGTPTLSQIRALHQLGFQPSYETRLTVEDLAQRQEFAILSVNEPIGDQTISHAVVLLSVSPEQQEVTIANPLYGKETKTDQEMEEYWMGQAVYVEEKFKKTSS